MSDKPEQKQCNCSGHGQPGGASPQRMAGAELGKVLKAQVPQDYNANFNIRIVPARSLDKALLQPQCAPRGNVTGWHYGAVAVDPGVVATLNKVDKPIVAWLAKDAANAKLFLADPLAAIREAGVQLTRAEEKALARAHSQVSATRVVGPGTNVASLSAQVYPKGRVGSIGSTKPDGKPEGKTDDFGCGPKRKG